MAKYVFPAIFTPEAEGGYSVRFADLINCFTDADNLTDAMQRANDALCLTLYDMEQDCVEIPLASSVEEAQTQAEAGEFVTLIACDTLVYRKLNENRAVKKTLSIPSWLNEMAERAGINFSNTLQEALKQQLHIQI